PQPAAVTTTFHYTRHAAFSLHGRPPLSPSFLLIIRHPPTPTLFPYTTLFRSIRIPDRDASVPVAARQESAVGAEGNRVHPVCMLDRKSTRLNSSHVKISYAVFCLKKKKKIGRRDGGC